VALPEPAAAATEPAGAPGEKRRRRRRNKKSVFEFDFMLPAQQKRGFFLPLVIYN
jgi:hypothetical protein